MFCLPYDMFNTIVSYNKSTSDSTIVFSQAGWMLFAISLNRSLGGISFDSLVYFYV